MLPKILRNFNVFVDGRGYAGRIDEITLPKLTIKTEEYRAGGMDIPINIDMGMEKLEADFTFSEYDTELFRLFGLINGNSVSLTLRGGMQGSGSSNFFHYLHTHISHSTYPLLLKYSLVQKAYLHIFLSILT